MVKSKSLSKTKSVPPRMYGILARDGRSVTVFRQGPNRHYLLVRWWLHNNRVEEGHWLRAKIYVRRSDLSHDGDLLVYFAARHSEPLYSWTAVSRSPYFTALALWPKGDSWGGGGLFQDNRTIMLNHRATEMVLHPAHQLPGKIRVAPCGHYSGNGEDHPIEKMRMERDGWTHLQSGETHFHGISRGPSYTLDPPDIRQKSNPKFKTVLLRKIHSGGGGTLAKHYLEDYVICSSNGADLRAFHRLDWAEWAPNGDLLIANEGLLLRLPKFEVRKAEPDAFKGCELISDLTDRKFEAVAPPHWARQWK